MSYKQKFLDKVVPGAIKTQKQYGIFASVTLGQAAIESDWGRSVVANEDNNFFGIKYPGNHDKSLTISRGRAASDGNYYTHYESVDDSISDHGYFLKNNPRYTKHGVFSAKTPYEQLKALKAAKYDTKKDDYAEYTMNSIIKPNNFTQYDDGSYVGSGATDSANNAQTQQMIEIESTNYQIVKGSEKYGDYLFGRRHKIVISDNEGTAVDVSDLHCTFKVTKTMLLEPNTSEITIYNLNAKTENAISMVGTRVIIEAGYEGSQFGKIFDGDILQCIREKEDAHTYKLTIIALDSDRAINLDVANFSIMRGQTLRSMVEHLANEAKDPVKLGTIAECLSNKTLTRGKVFFGKSSDFMEQIAKSNGLKYYMDDGVLNLVDLEELPKDEIVELNPKSGLIGVPEQTEYGIRGQSLINPQIKLNALLHVDSSLIKAKKIEFSNSNTIPAGQTDAGGVVSSGTTAGGTEVRNKILAEAKRICDDPNSRYSQPYRGQTRNGLNYWDCSSFVKHCYEVAGLTIVDVARYQYSEAQKTGKIFEKSEAKPGDMVFWFSGSTCSHIAIYAGDNDVYAARNSSSRLKPEEQVFRHSIYSTPKFGRPGVLIAADNNTNPSSANNQ